MVAGCNISAKEDTGTGKEAGVVFLRVWAVRSHGLPRTVLRDGVCGYEKSIRSSLLGEFRMPDNSVIRQRYFR